MKIDGSIKRWVQSGLLFTWSLISASCATGYFLNRFKFFNPKVSRAPSLGVDNCFRVIRDLSDCIFSRRRDMSHFSPPGMKYNRSSLLPLENNYRHKERAPKTPSD